MTNLAYPLPNDGGSYIRNADGSLTRQAEIETEAAPASEIVSPEVLVAELVTEPAATIKSPKFQKGA